MLVKGVLFGRRLMTLAPFYLLVLMNRFRVWKLVLLCRYGLCVWLVVVIRVTRVRNRCRLVVLVGALLIW